MIVCTARNQIESTLYQTLCQCLCIFYNVLAVFLEFRLHCFAEANSLTSNHVHQWPTLCARENSLVDFLCQFFIVAENQTATRATQRLVGCGGGNICIRNWRWMHACCNQTGNVCHVNHQICSNRLCNFCQLREINDSWICTCTCNNHLRLVFLCQSSYLVIINGFIIAQTIGNEVEILTGNIDRRTVCQMSAVCQTHAQYGITWLQQSKIYSGVCLRTRVRLYICKLCTEQLLCTVNGNFFYNVNIFASAVVPLMRQTFCILIGENRTHCCHNSRRNNIFTGNQFEISSLSFQFFFHCCTYFRIVLSNESDGIHHILIHSGNPPFF